MEEWKSTKCGNCVIQRKKPICNSCIRHHYYKPMTNAQKIRSMTDEELAELFSKIDKGWDAICGSYISIKPGVLICGRDDFGKQILQWIQSEAE